MFDSNPITKYLKKILHNSSNRINLLQTVIKKYQINFSNLILNFNDIYNNPVQYSLYISKLILNLYIQVFN